MTHGDSSGGYYRTLSPGTEQVVKSTEERVWSNLLAWPVCPSCCEVGFLHSCPIWSLVEPQSPQRQPFPNPRAGRERKEKAVGKQVSILMGSSSQWPRVGAVGKTVIHREIISTPCHHTAVRGANCANLDGTILRERPFSDMHKDEPCTGREENPPPAPRGLQAMGLRASGRPPHPPPPPCSAFLHCGCLDLLSYQLFPSLKHEESCSVHTSVPDT